MNTNVHELAEQLEAAWQRQSAPLPPFTERGAIASAEDAYRVQLAWSQLRVRQGDRILGRKIGLTSTAMQQQFGVGEPDYGCLWESRRFMVQDGQAHAPAHWFIQPRVEGEFAFRVARELRGPGVTLAGVLASCDAAALAVEIVDSRIENWRIKLIDTVADNASYGGFAVADWSQELLRCDLPNATIQTWHNDVLAAQGCGAAVIGHPAAAAAWLVNKLAPFGVALGPGDIILSGAVAKSVPAQLGDTFRFELPGQQSLTLEFV